MVSAERISSGYVSLEFTWLPQNGVLLATPGRCSFGHFRTEFYWLLQYADILATPGWSSFSYSRMEFSGLILSGVFLSNPEWSSPGCSKMECSRLLQNGVLWANQEWTLQDGVSLCYSRSGGTPDWSSLGPPGFYRLDPSGLEFPSIGVLFTIPGGRLLCSSLTKPIQNRR